MNFAEKAGMIIRNSYFKQAKTISSDMPQARVTERDIVYNMIYLKQKRLLLRHKGLGCLFTSSM